MAESVIMQIGNWLTRSFFLRYAIADERDIADAVQKLEPASRDKKRSKTNLQKTARCPPVTAHGIQ